MCNYLIQVFLSLALLLSFIGTGEAQTFPYSGLTSTSIAAANYGIIDWDNDGDNDILVHAQTGPGGASPYCRVLLNDGAASFSDGGWPFPCGEASFETRDFDADGKTDLIINLGRDGVRFYRMTASGLTFSFQAPESLRSAGIGLGDIDGDTDLDLLICGLSDSLEPRTLLYRNIGNALVSVAHNIPNTASVSFQGGCNLVGIDSDALADVAIAGCQSTFPSCGANKRLYLFKGIEGSTFQSQGQLASTGGDGTAVWADIDSDGDLDWIVQSSGPKVFVNHGNFSFSTISLAGGQRTESRFTTLDYDQDGDLDILERWTYSITGQAQTAVYRNDGGTFLSVAHTLNSSYGHSIAADLDGDIDPEIVIGDVSASDIVYRNTLKSIIGVIRLNGVGQSGVTISLSGAAVGTTTSSTAGRFTFLNVPTGSFLLSPSYSGYGFSPTSRTIQINLDSSVDTVFVASQEPTPTPTPSATPTASPTSTPTPTPTGSLGDSSGGTVTPTPVAPLPFLPAPAVRASKKSADLSISGQFQSRDRVIFRITGPKNQTKAGQRSKGKKRGGTVFTARFTKLSKGTYQATWELIRATSETQRSSSKTFKIK